MPRYFLAIILLCCHSANAQYDKEGAGRLLRTAVSSWQSRDTTETMQHLKNFYRSYPDNAVSAMVCLTLGRVYIPMNKVDSARAVLNEGLQTGEAWISAYADCSGHLFPLSTFTSWKARICLLLSDMAEKENDYKLSLHYLNLSDTKFKNFEPTPISHL